MDTPDFASLNALAAPDLAAHPGFRRLYRPGHLTLGLILPLETHPGRPAPTMEGHVQTAQRAEALGFARSGCAMCRFMIVPMATLPRFSSRWSTSDISPPRQGG